jgi:hypothetical protein
MIVLTIEIVGHECSSLFTSFYSHIMSYYPDITRHYEHPNMSCCGLRVSVSEVQHAAWSPSILPPRDTWPLDVKSSQPFPVLKASRKKNRPGNDDNSLRT